MLEFLFVYSCAYFHFSTELLSFIIDLSLIQSTLYWCLLSWNLKKNCRHSWTNNVEITCDTLAVHTKGEANYHERFQSDFKNENFSPCRPATTKNVMVRDRNMANVVKIIILCLHFSCSPKWILHSKRELCDVMRKKWSIRCLFAMCNKI